MHLHGPPPPAYYHIYLNARQPATLFATADDYRDFLTIYARLAAGRLETFAYCLLPNHFHLFVRAGTPTADAPDSVLLALFNAYSVEAGRTTSLPQSPILTVPVRDPANYAHLVRYIHQNPTLHGYTPNFRAWRWSSYRAILSDRPSRVAVRTVLKWFHNADWFEDMHWTVQPDDQIGYLIRDD